MSENMQDENGSGQSPGKRERSTIGFPYSDLDSAVKVVQTVHAEGGGHCTLDQLAAWQGYSAVTNGAFRQQLNAARIFGLATYSRNSVSLTDLGYRIVNPEQAGGARVDSFLEVPLYKAVYAQFRGRALPPDAGLESVFADLGVARKQTDKARYVFQRSAQQAGFFNAGADRLVEPSIEQARHDGVPTSGEPADAAMAGQPTAVGERRNELHPLIQGLVETLPKLGDPWSDSERDAWLDAARANFALIYKPNRPALTEGKPDQVGQEPDRG